MALFPHLWSFSVDSLRSLAFWICVLYAREWNSMNYLQLARIQIQLFYECWPNFMLQHTKTNNGTKYKEEQKNDNKIKQKETEWKTISRVSFFRWLMPEFCATFCYSRIYSFLMLFLRFVTVYFQEQHWICLTYEAKMEHSTVNCWTSQFFICCFFSSPNSYQIFFHQIRITSHKTAICTEMPCSFQKKKEKKNSKATKQITFDI